MWDQSYEQKNGGWWVALRGTQTTVVVHSMIVQQYSSTASTVSSIYHEYE